MEKEDARRRELGWYSVTRCYRRQKLSDETFEQWFDADEPTHDKDVEGFEAAKRARARSIFDKLGSVAERVRYMTDVETMLEYVDRETGEDELWRFYHNFEWKCFLEWQLEEAGGARTSSWEELRAAVEVCMIVVQAARIKNKVPFDDELRERERASLLTRS